MCSRLAAWLLIGANFAYAHDFARSSSAVFETARPPDQFIQTAFTAEGCPLVIGDPPHCSSDECACSTSGDVSSSPLFSLQEFLGMDKSAWFVSGHIQQGVNYNNRHPANPPGGFGNAPSSGLVFRSGEYQLNQLYLSVGKTTDTSQSSFDVGGQIDLVFGTDYVFMQSLGLETELDGTNKWNGETGSGFLGRALHGIALPQMYAEFAYETLAVRIGHFYNIFGHEELLPTENFYYTTSYALFFNGTGESAPVTGVLAQWQITPQLLVGSGFHRGQAKWEDNNDILNLMGIVELATPDRDVILTYSFDVGAEDNAGENTVFAQSAILEWQIGEHSSYILNSSVGVEENVATGGGTAKWYGFANYLAHELSEELIAGVRYEFFDDIDGTRVFPRIGFPANAPGVYHALTFGLNYLPHSNVKIRPELRWDWFDPQAALPSGPFNNSSNRSQFMAAVDLLITF